MALPTFPDRFNMADWFLFDRLKEGRGSHPALLCGDGVWTYAQVAEQSLRAAAAFRAAGVNPGERVLIALPDGPDFAFAWFGTIAAGAVGAMVNPILPPKDYAYYLEYTQSSALVLDAALLEKLADVLAAAKHLKAVFVSGGTGGHTDFAAARAGATPMKDAHPTRAEDPSLWLFTSGSTGEPKAAVHRHRDFPFNTEVFAKRTIGMRPEDRTLSVPKLFFGYATGTNLMFPFAVGATACLFPERATAAEMFRQIARFRPTVLTTVPTMINAMLQAPEAAGADLSCLRFGFSAGEALPPELYRRWTARFGVELYDGIGSAEMFHIYITNRPGDVRPGSLGRLVEGYRARIRGPEGQDLPDGQAGTLWIGGPTAALEYWKAPEKSRETFHHGPEGSWVKTGDMCRRDADGYFWMEGRTDDMLKVGGIWVAPAEIEDCLLKHPAVSEAAVVGYAEEGLVKPRAFLVLKAGQEASPALAAEVQEFVKRTLAPYKYPREVVFRDALPKNDRGKLDRKALKA